MDIKTKSYALLLITLVSGSLLPVLLTVSRGANLYEFFFGVYAVASVTSTAFLVYRKKLGELTRTLRDLRKVAIISVIGIVSYFPIQFGIAFAERFVSAALATAVFRTSPLLMLLLLPPLLREKLSKYQIIALVLAFAGLYIGISGGNLVSVFGGADFAIVSFLIVMALGYALSVVLIKKYMFDIGIIIALSSVVMLAIFAVMMALNGFPHAQMSAEQLVVMTYIGAFFNVFSFYMYFASLRPLKATLVANVYFFSPFITFLVAAVFLGEAIQPYYIVIAILAGVGMIIQGFDRTGGRYLPRSKSKVGHMKIFDVTGVFAGTGEVGIRSAIEDGGRVLAMRIEGRHSKHVDDMSLEQYYAGIYTDSQTGVGNSN